MYEPQENLKRQWHRSIPMLALEVADMVFVQLDEGNGWRLVKNRNGKLADCNAAEMEAMMLVVRMVVTCVVIVPRGT